MYSTLSLTVFYDPWKAEDKNAFFKVSMDQTKLYNFVFEVKFVSQFIVSLYNLTMLMWAKLQPIRIHLYLKTRIWGFIRHLSLSWLSSFPGLIDLVLEAKPSIYNINVSVQLQIFFFFIYLCNNVCIILTSGTYLRHNLIDLQSYRI